MATAPAVMSCPATATETCSEAARSFSEPATTITPQPMAKLPAIMARLAEAQGAVTSAQRWLRSGHAQLQRSTFSASGLTRLVGSLLMKLMTLRNAAPKYIS